MAKKNFQNVQNPALAFLSPQAPTAPAAAVDPHSAPAGYHINPLYVENRTRRVQLALQPSVYEKAKKQQLAGGFPSLNDYIHSLIEQAEGGQNEN